MVLRDGVIIAAYLFRRRKNRNKQILMITDGKPSCHFEYGRLYRNAYGLDRRIVNRVLDEAEVLELVRQLPTRAEARP